MTDEVRILDDALVADYLRRHPEFFLQQDELLAELRIPHARGSSISLVERQLAVLRERSLDMHQRLGRLVDVARDNDRLFELTRQLTLDLLDADSLATLVATLEDGLRERFKVPAVSLLVFTDYQLDVARGISLAQAKKQVPGLLGEQVVSGALREHERAFLFGEEAAARVRSAAVASFGEPRLLGMLALGSPDAQKYGHTVGTLFLGFVAQVLARVLPPLLQKHCSTDIDSH
ncbi:MAG: DUF484 family protein [Gammaproteobacteria bacterium]|jgi:uncharacterized protein YigA (DUF484 family)|nr:DUF484 family protein [Gammaproteobacteria bacterium]